MSSLASVVNLIVHQRADLSPQTALLVAISGIDGSGKGYITHRLAGSLAQRHLNIAAINIDGWLNLPDKRFSQINPAEHFYHHAIRFDELFTQLVFPLRDQRAIALEADYAEETASAYCQHLYQFEDVDVILLEGIYLLKREFQSYYDLSIWIKCSFETALERAIARSQEGLSPAETVNVYQTIYFPAQRLHFEVDQPQKAATVTVNNDG